MESFGSNDNKDVNFDPLGISIFGSFAILVALRALSNGFNLLGGMEIITYFAVLWLGITVIGDIKNGTPDYDKPDELVKERVRNNLEAVDRQVFGAISLVLSILGGLFLVYWTPGIIFMLRNRSLFPFTSYVGTSLGYMVFVFVYIYFVLFALGKYEELKNRERKSKGLSTKDYTLSKNVSFALRVIGVPVLILLLLGRGTQFLGFWLLGGYILVFIKRRGEIFQK